MLPDPLHPAVVHVPIALAVLIPALAIVGVVLIRQGLLPARSWAGVVLLQAVLVGSAWLALETGEEEEERVEQVVAERHIEEHEEAAERFLVFAGLGLLVSVAGLLPHGAGRWGRLAGTASALAVLGAGAYVGHLGGELVYKHGAAQAYTERAATAGAPRVGNLFDHDDD